MKSISAFTARPAKLAETIMAVLMLTLVYGLSRQAAVITGSSSSRQDNAANVSASLPSPEDRQKPVVVIDSGHPALCNRPKNRI